jgi:hypothetical protein
MAAVTYYICLELFIFIAATFKRYRGKYFWSILIATTGIILYNTANILTLFKNNCPMIFVHLCWNIGWGCTITGFSLVLWSRLELIVNVNSKRWLMRTLLAIIIFDGIVWNSIALGISFGLTLKYHKAYKVAAIINYIEVSLLVTQEIFLSCLYIFHTARFLSHRYGKETRRVIFLLVIIQILVVVLDAVLLGLLFGQNGVLAAVYHPLSQSIKLKLEFIVLNQLQELVKQGSGLSLDEKEMARSLHLRESNDRPWLPRKSRSSPTACPTVITGADQCTTPTYPNSTNSSSQASSGREKELERQYTDKTLLGVEVSLTGDFDVARPSQMEDDIDRLEAIYLGRWETDTIV